MANEVLLYLMLRRCPWSSYIVRKERCQVNEEKEMLGGNAGLIS